MNWSAAVILVLGSASCVISTSSADPYYLPFQHAGYHSGHLQQRQGLVNWEYDRYRRGSYYSPSLYRANSFYNKGYSKITSVKASAVKEDTKKNSIMPPRLTVPDSPFPFRVFPAFSGFQSTASLFPGSSQNGVNQAAGKSDLINIDDLINLAGIGQPDGGQPSASLIDTPAPSPAPVPVNNVQQVKIKVFNKPEPVQDILQPELEILKLDVPNPNRQTFVNVEEEQPAPQQLEVFMDPAPGQLDTFTDPQPSNTPPPPPPTPPRRTFFMPVPAVPGLPFDPETAGNSIAAEPRKISVPELVLQAVPAVPGRPVLEQ